MNRIKPYQRYRVVDVVDGHHRAYVTICGKRFLCEESYGYEYVGTKRSTGFPFQPYRFEKVIGDYAYLVDAKGIIWIFSEMAPGFHMLERPCRRCCMVYIWQHDPEMRTSNSEVLHDLFGIPHGSAVFHDDYNDMLRWLVEQD